ncbi:glycoside hydrolase family 16 protein [Aspergillus clavatus NRRL 1]|uniref:endo-1,3(4)-beta-glucanase n=1 Tax=Aspergillus clavatus (strain ATCC 1007 / CBS 513.65 / DSM 816 / NCTC 3887 / NRRL 1 / QM 1276 / 107) TaxID=344612 RepID=A1CRD7_ASPCL|nr:endo-1,3(4)-beta-glucanase, putative [Aspergillus clavatus NRRL 1]EAW08208.1 endo-1,3(4)-beta-glucanase, putative [Aspergillus clavatus NRRL 1]
MHVWSTLLPVLGLGLSAQQALAAYVLQDDYATTASFFNQFSFWTGEDPTHGFVNYVDRATAQNAGLIAADNGVYLGVDYTNTAPAGRQSVRLTSTKSYTHGLVIIDLAHMPASICGAWPAFWMVGPDWPNHGEIDIIEGVNDQTNNAMTLHTADGCSIAHSGFSGTLQTSNCFIKAPGQPANTGCGIAASAPNTYGTPFNAGGGGVYATEWTSSAISVWFFPRTGIPADIAGGYPDPSSWGLPQARFAGDCNIDSHFSGLQIVFDTTFCGDWAGAVWGSGACAAKAGTCNDYVANNPRDFQEAYWRVNSLKVYQDAAGAYGGNTTAQARARGHKHASQHKHKHNHGH